MTYALGQKLLDFIEGHTENKAGPRGPVLLRDEVAEALGFALGSYLKNLTDPADRDRFAAINRAAAVDVIKRATKQ